MDVADEAGAEDGRTPPADRLPQPPRTSRAAREADSPSTPPPTIRCWAAPTPKSAPTPAAITSARAWADCLRCPASAADAAVAAAAGYQLMETSIASGQIGQGRNVALRWHRHQPRGSRAVRRPEPARSALTARPRRHRRAARSARRPPSPPATTPAPPPPWKPDSPPSAPCARNCRRWASPIPPATKSISASSIKERDYQDAVLAAHGITFDAVADDGLVIAGQPVKLSMLAVNRGASDVDVTGVTVAGFDAPGACKPGRREEGRRLHLRRRTRTSRRTRKPHHALLRRQLLEASRKSRPSTSSIPTCRSACRSRPSPFRVTFHREGRRASKSRAKFPSQFRYVKDIYAGDKRMELNVVPGVLRAGHAAAGRDSRAARPNRSSARSTSPSPTAPRAPRRPTSRSNCPPAGRPRPPPCRVEFRT